jgi:hypothetical protein
MRTCLKCSAEIPAGRRSDARFCGDGCRLAAEYERRRIQRRLGYLEDAARQWQQFAGYEQQKAHVQGEIVRSEARLRELLGG